MPNDCKHVRTINVTGKVSDLCFVRYNNQDESRERDGYVPEGLGIGGGDYLEFKLCLDCGRILGDFPIPQDNVEDAFPEK